MGKYCTAAAITHPLYGQLFFSTGYDYIASIEIFFVARFGKSMVFKELIDGKFY
jgi:hypothetical protein